MDKQQFYQFVNKLILPLFIGSYLDGEEPSSVRDSEVAYGKRNSLLIKPTKTDEYRLILKRGQPFQIFEVNLLKSIIAELNKIALISFEDDSYLTVLQENAIEKSICESLCEHETANCMFNIINEVQKWAARTYEGRKIAIGVILN